MQSIAKAQIPFYCCSIIEVGSSVSKGGNNNNNRDCPKKCLLDLQRGARIVICDCEPPTNECGQLKYRPSSNEHDGIPIGYERFQVAC